MQTADTPYVLSRAHRLAGRARRRFAAMMGRSGWEWSIGIFAGPSPMELQPMRRRPVLTRRDVRDVRAKFVADPFLLRSRERWWMFFEVWDADRDKGVIGLSSSTDAYRWTYEGLVLEQPFHLSYPHVLEWEGRHYMVPESYEARAVRLYLAVDFPWRWIEVATLLKGEVLLDPTPFRWEGRWWMFVETDPQHRYDTLRLFSSERLECGWHEHPGSPVVVGDRRIARPAGSVVIWQGRPLRFAQDCEPEYGVRVRAFEIEELTMTGYRERCRGVALDAGRLGWSSSGMHHIDAKPHDVHGWIASVDGRS